MADQTLAKYINELRVLTLLRTTGKATRADIARRLKLTPATITRLISGLGERQLVNEFQDEISGVREPGRPGVSVELNPEGAYFLGVEIGVGHMRFATIDLRAEVVISTETHTSESLAPSAAVSKIVGHVQKIAQNSRYRGKLQGLGVTVPGLVNSDGHIVHLPIMGWKDVNLRELLQSKVNMPVFVENNADAAAFAAAYTRRPVAGSCALYLKLGTGCGGAAIINGRLLRGAQGMAGEFGHIRIADHGPRCYCGQTGCLETFVNLKALARNLTGDDSASSTAPESLPIKTAEKAAAGDQAAQSAIDKLCNDLSRGIASLTNIFNPAVIFLGGPMRPVLKSKLGDIQQRVADTIVPGMTVPVIKMSEHGDQECAVGAATVAHHHLFDVPWTDMANAYEETEA